MKNDMKKNAFLAAVSMVLPAVILLVSCEGAQNNTPDTFTSTYYLDEEGRSISISGNSHAETGERSEYLLKIKSDAGGWQDEYWVLLLDNDSVVERVSHERFDLPGSTEMQRTIVVQFPEGVVGALGLCIVVPGRATTISTLSVGVDDATTTGWPDADYLRSYIEGDGG
jgi:hypothetical protein